MDTPRSDHTVLEQPRRRAVVAAAALIVALGALALFGTRGKGEARTEAVPEGLAWPVPGTGEQRITTEVLNGTGRTGLARLGARLLRQHGIDVVATGNADSHATTRVIVRRGSREAAESVRRALGAGTVDSTPDSRLLLDVTVILGDDFRPVTPLHP